MSRDRFFVFILPLFIPFSVAITSVYYGVCVGINDYPGTINDLLYCVADAEEMKRAFVNEQGWNSNNIELLTDGSASEYAIQNKIQNMPKNENNYNLFFYAGHGDSEELGGWDGIIPANSINARITPLELQSWFGSSYQFCCYLDACGTGIFANDMSHGVISSACKADETADEGLDGHGYFTYYLLSGLANNAADPDGIVSAEELHDYAAPRVTSYNSSQHPQLGDNFDGYLNFRSLDPPVITECWSDPNANPYNYRETNRAKLTFSRPNGCDNFILYWEFNNGEEKRKKQFDINTVPLNKELEVDWYRTVNCDVRDDEFGGPDARCEHYELWIEFEGINVSSDEITVRLHFEPFYSYPDVDEFVSFRVKAIDEWGQESDWSDACSCSIVDDPQRLTLVSPVGGEVWHEGTHQTIQWTSDNYDKQVKIFFSSGGDWVSIAGDSTENDGEFVWTTPGDISDSCRILVEGTPEGAPKDKSREFSIIPLPEDTTITQLVFATAEQTFDNVSVSSVMTVQSKNVSDELVPVMGRDVVLDLASTSPTGEFSLKARPFEPITSVTLKDGAYAVNFYYRDNSEGDYTITVSETPDRSWSDAQQAVHITDADRIEAENMTLNGMHIIDRAGASAGQAIQPGQPYGYAEYEFFGDMAQYKIIAGVLDEPDGHSEGLFKVNGATLDDWFFCDTPPDSEEAWRETEIGLASLQSGDVLSFRVYPDSSELGLVDYIKTVYVGEYSYAPQKLYCEFLAGSATDADENWENAIDGDVEGWDGTTTAEGNPPWAVFGFGDAIRRDVSKVRLLTDTGVGYSERWTTDFRVQVSETDTAAASFVTVLDTTKQSGDWEEFTFDPVSIKYVKLIIDAPTGGWRQLGEFEIWGVVDKTNPSMSVETVNLTTVEVQYSEQVVNADNVNNYTISPNLGDVTLTDMGGNAWRLSTENERDPDSTFVLTVANVQDLAGNGLSPSTAAFSGWCSSAAVRVEGEDMTLSNMVVHTKPECSNGLAVKPASWVMGTAQHTFAQASGDYVIVVKYLDENDGACTGTLYVNNSSIDSWTWNAVPAGGQDAWRTHTTAPISIANGDDILLKIQVGAANKNENGYVDYIEFQPAGLQKRSVQQEKPPQEYRLYANYPNPFNPTTTIKYDLPKAGPVTLKIYNMRGRLVQTLVDERRQAGRHAVAWDAGNMATGLYFYELTAGDFRQVRKMLLVK